MYISIIIKYIGKEKLNKIKNIIYNGLMSVFLRVFILHYIYICSLSVYTSHVINRIFVNILFY